MANKQNRILCIDIGGDSVKIAEFSRAEDSVVLEKYSFQEYNTGDVSTDDPQYKLKVLDIVRDICAAKEYAGVEDVYLSISGQNAFIRFVKVPAMTDDPAKIQKLLEFEAKQNIPFPEEEIVYGSQIIGSRDEDSSQVEAMFAIMKNSDVESYLKAIETSKKEVREVEIASTACYNACHFNGLGVSQCEMLLNIGGRSSTLIFVDQGQFFVRTFLTAGHAITQQISKEFNISYDDAEELKRKHGFVGLGGAYEEPASAVAATVSKIIRNVMTRLHGEIIRTINVYRANHGRKPEKLYLTGGSSVMTYTPHFFSEKLRIPVEYFNPFQIVAVSPTIDKENLASVAHLFSEVIGLAIRRVVECPVQVSLLPVSRKRQEFLRQKFPYFYASCVALIFCVSVTFWSFSKQYSTAKELASRSKSIADSTTKMMERVQKSDSALKAIRSDYDTAKTLLARRNIWMNIINKLQAATPKGVWYTSMEAVLEVKQSAAQSKAGTKKKDGDMMDMSGMGGMMGGMPIINPVNMEGMGTGLGTGGFGGMMGGDSKKKEVKNYEWIVLKGNIIIPSQDSKYESEKQLSAEETYNLLKQNLQECGLFEEFTIDDTDRMDRNFKLAMIGSNVSSFVIEAKLINPIER